MNDEPKSDGDENCANGRDIVKLHDPSLIHKNRIGSIPMKLDTSLPRVFLGVFSIDHCFTPPRDTPHRVGCIMNNENDIQWKKLCRQASVEKDPEKLNQLAREINRLLEAKQNTNRS